MAKLKTNYVDQTGLWSWWIITGVVGVFTVYNLYQVVQNRRCRRVQTAHFPSLSPSAEGEKDAQSTGVHDEGRGRSAGLLSVVRRFPNTLATVLNVTTLRLPFYPSAAVSEALFIVAYIAILYPLILYRTYGQSSSHGLS